MNNLDEALNSLCKAKEKIGSSELLLLIQDAEEEIKKHQSKLNEFGMEELQDDDFEIPF